LELSGIGNPEILNNFGIDTKVDLPGVGEGTIEHMYIPISFGVFVESSWMLLMT
jgi:DUF1009 family protein